MIVIKSGSSSSSSFSEAKGRKVNEQKKKMRERDTS